MNIKVTVTRPELTADERRRKEQEVKDAVAAFFTALQQREEKN